MYVRNIIVETNRHKRKSTAPRTGPTRSLARTYPTFDAHGHPIPQDLSKHLTIADLPEEEFEQILTRPHWRDRRPAWSKGKAKQPRSAPKKVEAEMSPPRHEVYVPIDNETEITAFCLRRMETITESDCRFCFDTHEQLQTGYRQRFRCAELHWVEIADFLPLPRGNQGPNPSDSLPCPSISHPPQKRHRRWT